MFKNKWGHWSLYGILFTTLLSSLYSIHQVHEYSFQHDCVALKRGMSWCWKQDSRSSLVQFGNPHLWDYLRPGWCSEITRQNDWVHFLNQLGSWFRAGYKD